MLLRMTRDLGLLATAAAVLCLIAATRVTPKTFPLQASIFCTALCAAALFAFLLGRTGSVCPRIADASFSRKATVALGLPVSLYALISMRYFIFAFPRTWFAGIG